MPGGTYQHRSELPFTRGTCRNNRWQIGGNGMSIASYANTSSQPVRDKIATAVLDSLCENPEMDDRELKRVIARTAAREMTGLRLAFPDQQRMIEQLFHAMRGFDVLQPLM